jgi:hypothetical protein
MPLLQKNLKTGIGQIEFELDEAEYAAIGRVTAQWAYLEHVVYTVSSELIGLLGVPSPKELKSPSFTKRLGVLTQLSRLIEEEAIKKRLERLVSRIANAEQDRHKLTHGLWDWDPANPEMLNASSFRPGYEFDKRYDAASLQLLADRIAQISFCLEYPEGWDGAFAQMLAASTDANGQTAFASVSRRLVRQVLSARSEKDAER